MNPTVLGVAVGAVNRDWNRDVLDGIAFGSLAPAQGQPLQQSLAAQQELAHMDIDLASSSIPADLSLGGSIGGSNSGMMALADFGGLFGLDLGPDLGVNGGQPVPIQGSPSTLAASGLISTLPNASDQDLFSTSLDHPEQFLSQGDESANYFQQYLPDSLSKQFSSVPDFQAFALDGDYALGGRVIGGGAASDLGVSLTQSAVDNPVQATNSSGYSATNSFAAHRLTNMNGHLNMGDSGLGASQSLAAGAGWPSAYPTGSVELSLVALHYDNQGRIMMDAKGDGNTGGVAEGNMGGDTVPLVVSGLTNNGSGRPSQVSAVTCRVPRNGDVGIEPTAVTKGNMTSVTAPNGIGQGSRRAGRRTSYLSVPMPLPIPTRSRRPILMGWQGEAQVQTTSTVVQAREATPQASPSVMVVPDARDHQSEGGKRRRAAAVELGGNWDEERKRSASLRREMLGLRTINDTDDATNREQEGREKRRRVGSLSLPSNKEKQRETQVELNGSDEDSSDDDGDGSYYPSQSSSPDRSRPLHRSATALPRIEESRSRRQSESAPASTATSNNARGCSRSSPESGEHKQTKGKAKGSAALALAKVTRMSGKSPTSPWGTYVPFPSEESAEGSGISSGDVAEVRAGRKRRNGHIPLPVPVPDLIKKSRGRKVPYVAKEIAPQSEGSSASASKKLSGDYSKRTFVCEVPGCGKCFVRGEHLKRHVRSIHTHDKRMWFLFLL